jgi:hypothetical protein
MALVGCGDEDCCGDGEKHEGDHGGQDPAMPARWARRGGVTHGTLSNAVVSVALGLLVAAGLVGVAFHELGHQIRVGGLRDRVVVTVRGPHGYKYAVVNAKIISAIPAARKNRLIHHRRALLACLRPFDSNACTRVAARAASAVVFGPLRYLVNS